MWQKEKKGYTEDWKENQIAVFWKYNRADGKPFFKTKKSHFCKESLDHLITMLQKYEAEKTNLVIWPIPDNPNPNSPAYGLYVLRDKEE
jgi:hypothetical protein